MVDEKLRERARTEQLYLVCVRINGRFVPGGSHFNLECALDSEQLQELQRLFERWIENRKV